MAFVSRPCHPRVETPAPSRSLICHARPQNLALGRPNLPTPHTPLLTGNCQVGMEAWRRPSRGRARPVALCDSFSFSPCPLSEAPLP